MPNQSKDETYSEAETEARREAALRNMLATPHKPHKASKKGGKESREK
jgi:hypothetical protein